MHLSQWEDDWWSINQEQFYYDNLYEEETNYQSEHFNREANEIFPIVNYGFNTFNVENFNEGQHLSSNSVNDDYYQQTFDNLEHQSVLEPGNLQNGFNQNITEQVYPLRREIQNSEGEMPRQSPANILNSIGNFVIKPQTDRQSYRRYQPVISNQRFLPPAIVLIELPKSAQITNQPKEYHASNSLYLLDSDRKRKRIPKDPLSQNL